MTPVSDKSDRCPPNQKRHLYDVRGAAVLFGLIVVAVFALAGGLHARSFFVGDPGVKLIAARNAIAHPARPFEIDLPVVGGRSIPFVGPFFHVHDGHAHPATSEAFPLLSAPFIWLFGLRGAYVVPALGFLLGVWASAWLGIALDNRRSWTLLTCVAAICAPTLFYGLEFWEHSLAVGVAALATAMFVRQRTNVGLIASGMLLGLAILLRPEAALYCAVLLVAARWLQEPVPVNCLALTIAGVAAVCLPLAVGSWFHSGQFLGSHIPSNATEMTHRWMSLRLDILRTWFSAGSVWYLLTTLLAAVPLAAKDNRKARRWVGLFGLVLVATTAVAAGRHSFPVASLWNAAPTTLLVFSVPFLSDSYAGRRFLLTLALGVTLLVILSAPNDGGGQWGPRYLLFAFIPLPILIADVLAVTARTKPPSGAIVVAVILVASAVVQRSAYKELRSAKTTYGRIVDFVERNTPPGSHVVTDLWWLDQVTAALYPTRSILFVDNPDSAQQLFSLLNHRGLRFFIVRSTDESPTSGLAAWVDSGLVVPERYIRLADRQLVLIQVSARGSTPAASGPDELSKK